MFARASGAGKVKVKGDYPVDKFAKLMQDIGILWEKYRMMYLNGMLNTLGLALAATAIGCVIGLLCGILNTIPCAKNDPLPKRILLKLLRVIIRIYVEVFRGTPMMLQAVFIFYALPYFTDNALRFDNIWAASILIVSINTGAYMAESVRGGIISIDPGQTEGAKAIGMTHFQTMTSVILPQAIRNILPQIGNNYIINVKNSVSIVSRSGGFGSGTTYFRVSVFSRPFFTTLSTFSSTYAACSSEIIFCRYGSISFCISNSPFV